MYSNGYRAAYSPCYVQCFDEGSLLYLKNRTQLPLVMLIKDSVSDDRLADWSRSFYGVGVWVNVVAPHHTAENGYKNWIGNNATDFVARAHAHGLKVDPCMRRAGLASAGFFLCRRRYRNMQQARQTPPPPPKSLVHAGVNRRRLMNSTLV